MIFVCSGSTLYEGGWLVNCFELYPIPILLQLQSIPTMGASDVVSFQTTNGDWYLVIANGRDNMDNPNVDSLVFRWNGTAFQQSQVDFDFKNYSYNVLAVVTSLDHISLIQILSSIGASALKLFSVSSQLYLAVTSLTDTR